MTLADHDLLVIDQVTSFLADDFAIYSGDGQPVGGVTTEGGLLSRMMMGSRQLAVHELDGSLGVRVYDAPSLLQDHFEVYDAADQPIATIVQRFALLSERLSIHLATGDVLELRGNLWDYDFQVTGPVGVAAQVSRRWPGLAAGLLGRQRFVLSFAPGTPDFVRWPIIGAVVALDLVREKKKRRESASGSL